MSFSNLSTTALCWAAFGAADESQRYPRTVARAEDYLQRAAGGIDPEAIARAVTARYAERPHIFGPDPGDVRAVWKIRKGRPAWREIRPLPFELGALPREWFGAMRCRLSAMRFRR